EVQSTNEELETTNEELQSTNEELETTNEELKSTNEELETANEELRSRSEQLERQRAYTEAVPGSIGAGLMLDGRHHGVVPWNRWTDNSWGLRREATEGRLLLALDLGLPVAQLQKQLRAVLAGESGLERAVVRAIDRRGREFECNVIVTALTHSETETSGIVI